MRIAEIETRRLAVALKKPFKTALRTVHIAESVVVRIRCNNGLEGIGEAPPTMAITGESLESIEAFIQIIKPVLIGQNPLEYERVFPLLQQAAVGNNSAKAAVDMALYDLIGRYCKLPLYQLLGGYRKEIQTDYTVSVNSPEEMGEDAVDYVNSGFTVLKIKVGLDDIHKDLERVQEIRNRIGYTIKLRLDANQGWEAKSAIRAIRTMEDRGLDIELVEQPVKAHDLTGLKKVTDAVDTLIMADESVFSPLDAFEVLKHRAADLINIKLMKAGGIYRAETINRMAETCGVACMVGSMIESRIGISAAVHFAASKKNITRFDFDTPLMMVRDAVQGGVMYDGKTIKLPDTPGIGIVDIDW
ncbi:L-alanine-DL-glutamate epimerase [Paenibacillus sp. 1_12]|uniref:mandelate racemase/muconate lactonizing enzyme family protein n=1 Tax=Paenibacillus sp. 1_12 TaxID=1566278 RepID=UPI0008EF15BD|nr:dipeptide epimerase [Paenibacillus sp. 1_12]SFL67787.1 L-alanine-DL-glutamate epimerase [Paenibacillus sp. 1_12]